MADKTLLGGVTVWLREVTVGEPHERYPRGDPNGLKPWGWVAAGLAWIWILLGVAALLAWMGVPSQPGGLTM